VATSVVEGRQNPARVGSVRRVIYKDGTLQRIHLMELNDATHTITYDVITSEPPVPYSSAIHTIRLRRVTFGGKTLVEFTSDFSNDASQSVIADAKWKRLEILSGLREKVAQKNLSVNIEDFRKRAALAEQLIVGLTERLGALERARRGKKESKSSGQIFWHSRGETKDSERLVKVWNEFGLKVKEKVPGLLFYSGFVMADNKHFDAYCIWDSNQSVLDYMHELWKHPGIKSDYFDIVSNVTYQCCGPVSKATKEEIASRLDGAPLTYLDWSGWCRT